MVNVHICKAIIVCLSVWFCFCKKEFLQLWRRQSIENTLVSHSDALVDMFLHYQEHTSLFCLSLKFSVLLPEELITAPNVD